MFLTQFLLAIWANMKTITGATSAATVAISSTVLFASTSALSPEDWILMVCGAIGAVAQVVSAYAQPIDLRDQRSSSIKE